MPAIRLTQAAVDQLSPPKSGRIEHFDALLPSFALRIAQSGHRSWIVFYRISGRQRRYTFPFAAYDKVDLAREHARELFRQVERGIDPAEAKPAPDAARQPDDTVKAVVAQFIERYAKPKNKSWSETDKLLQRHVVSRWGDRDVNSISRRDVRELLDDLADRGYSTAPIRTLAAIRKLFHWCVERDILAASPVQNIKAPGKETERERVLTDEELVMVWRARQIRRWHLWRVCADVNPDRAAAYGGRNHALAGCRFREAAMDAATGTDKGGPRP